MEKPTVIARSETTKQSQFPFSNFPTNFHITKKLSVILSEAKNPIILAKTMRFFTPLRSVQNDSGVSFPRKRESSFALFRALPLEAFISVYISANQRPSFTL
jgi:hypothetical protein